MSAFSFKKCSGGESGFVLLFKSPSSHISELFLEGVPGEANVDFPGADLLGQLLVQPPVVHHILPLLTNLETARQETLNVGFNQPARLRAVP